MPISDEYRRLRGDFLLHYTHSDNQQSIINWNYVIFSQSILSRNNIIPTHITDSSSRSIDLRLGYNSYVFLVFSSSHPLIYKKIKYDNQLLVYYMIDVSILDVPGVYIADRVATDSIVTLYTPEQALEILQIAHCHDGFVDRNVWDEVKKYEILIPDMINLNQFSYRGR